MILHQAFKYLEDKHFVHVIDYSSEVVDRYEDESVWGDFNTVLYKLCKVLSEWSVVLEKVGNFQIQLERNEFLETTHGVWSPARDVYAKSNQFLSLILPKCHEAYETNHSVFTGLEVEHAKLLRESNDNITQFRMNVRLHLIHINSVYIDNFICCFILCPKSFEIVSFTCIATVNFSGTG
jgi:hypothetical protein